MGNFSCGLVDDLQDCLDQLVDREQYRVKGSKMMNQYESGHAKQRSAGFKGKYMNSKKSAMSAAYYQNDSDE
eukprot:NODE_6192_length_465_cov_343.639423_g4685_i0.p2 GENE.NODE_6192_length_465_cov_343.639423_g4685_i0~~NODE_6192_length_465_cov_343.639423_g4685_i0.p2  ORF type:complete len:80 (+),score=39.39 NODE_6192_length_465_cov_343.639423_g4685_i0:26-241(+)